VTLEATTAGVELVKWLVLGTLGVFGFTLLWDFVRGLARG
jgi:hypothetical protein